MKSLTAGKIPSEARLRAYFKCSNFYKFGGKVSPTDHLMLVQGSVEKTVTALLRNPTADIAHLNAKHVYGFVNRLGLHEVLLEGQIRDIVTRTILQVHEILQFFPEKNYVPVLGPIPYILKVSKTPIQVMLPATFKSNKNLIVHGLCFTPYHSPHAAKWDPLTQLKLSTLQRVLVDSKVITRQGQHFRKAEVQLHVVSVTEAKVYRTMLNNRELSMQSLEQITNIVKSMERGLHYPLLPCPYNCEYKDKCQPVKANDK